MKKGFYAKMAFSNIRKNYRFFIPHILTGAGLLGSFYIILTLAMDGRLHEIKGGDYIPTFMVMGVAIIGLLSIILLFYTNSFLMKQRKREFGLYNILGMEKSHIGKVLFFESLFSNGCAIILGLAFGILFYKLCSLAVCRLLGTELIVGFYFITLKTILPAGLAFLVLDLIIYFINQISIGRMKPVDLLKSTKVGEKEPKVKWPLLILGILTLGGGYYISLTTESPLKALLLFFVAIILVIIGTYFLLTAGSIWVLKGLKKNKKYYYNKKHMPAVSGLLYRMKQNAVGMASIAILATGVLVMLSTTLSLYTRAENILASNYPDDCYITNQYGVFENGYENDQDYTFYELPVEYTEETITQVAKKHNLSVTEFAAQDYLEVAYVMEGNELSVDTQHLNIADNLAGLANILFITEEDYVKTGGEPLHLEKDEVEICPFNITDKYPYQSITIHGKKYQIKAVGDRFPIKTPMVSVVNVYGMVVADEDVLNDIYEAQKLEYGTYASNYSHRIVASFDNHLRLFDVGEDFTKDLRASFEQYIQEHHSEAVEYSTPAIDSVWDARTSIYGMYGTLLFLGILLGLVCLFATVLIIYYKQISEGYEDRDRFQIMEKVGMSKAEVKTTIRKQTLMVFFIPLIVAGVHMIFAIPLLTKLLKVLLLSNPWTFVMYAAICFVAFAVIYVVIYTLTARTYYKIVHNED
ncbi:MAG: ABC transporter permease [Lachnospiraceae bacterium]|nr:ABC transporter permease [Lachnospiraceae bacterium]